MKLKNKKTGIIMPIVIHNIAGKNYETLKEINEDWEDYEEPKEWWYIDIAGEVKQGEGNVPEHLIAGMKLIGNYFETKEAELAVRKLKAWKRLKDAGCEFKGYMQEGDTVSIELLKGDDFSFDDLDLLFGGEE